jgi:hypothetical protein
MAGSARAKITTVVSPAMQAVTATLMSMPGPGGKEFPEHKARLDLLRSAIPTRKRLAIH